MKNMTNDDDKSNEISSLDSICKEFLDESKKLENQLKVAENDITTEMPELENPVEKDIDIVLEKFDNELKEYDSDIEDVLQIYSDKVRNMCCVLVHIANPCILDKQKMVESLTDTIFDAIEKLHLKKDKLNELSELIKYGNAFDIKKLREKGPPIKEDLWNLIEQDNILPFAKILFDKKPSELNKPYAQIGKGEFMFLMLHPSILKKDKGDLTLIFEGDDQKLVEVKGEKGRLTSKVSKDAFIIRAKEIAEKYGFDKEKEDFLNFTYINSQAQNIQTPNDEDLKKFIKEDLIKLEGQAPNEEDLKKIIKEFLVKNGIQTPNEEELQTFIKELLVKTGSQAANEEDLKKFIKKFLVNQKLKMFIMDLLKETGVQEPEKDDLKSIVQDDKIIIDNLNNFLISGFFEYRCKEDGFNYLMMVSEEKIYLIEANIDNFKSLTAENIIAKNLNLNAKSYPLGVELSFKK